VKTVYISLLRGINVGGKKKVEMDKLKLVYEDLGFNRVRSYIQSGNLMLETTKNWDTKKLSSKIEKQLAKAFGFDILVILREQKELQEVVENNPFLIKNSEPEKLHVTFLRESPKSFPVEELGKAKFKEEDFVLKGKEIYLYLPYGYGRTKLNNSFFEKKLGITATTRNWRTVNTLSRLI
jgi:uncharacterized protein (DUF1697 family)